MKKIKIATIVGARPQFVKTAVLSPHLRKRFNEIIIHTGQHYDNEMSDIFFDELKIPKPNYNLGIRCVKQGEQTAQMLTEIEKILINESPRLVIVYGDTNSTLAGALAAAKLRIPVAHIEAGLRSFNRSMPEEINRLIVDHISDFLFCPTKTAVSNLKNEGITRGVYLVGDVMYDGIRHYLPKAKVKSKILSKFGLRQKSYYLLTIHRVSNTKDLQRLKIMLSALDNFDLPVVFTIHPRTKIFLGNAYRPKKSLLLIPPVAYLDMLVLEQNAKAIFTDSGGVQKEAFFLRTPCITLRDETEWVETVAYKMNIITGFNIDKVVRALKSFSEKKLCCFSRDDPHGDGFAARKIAKIIKHSLGKHNNIAKH